jgi:2-iminobutanoate/2-iminopropanoate deaminase
MQIKTVTTADAPTPAGHYSQGVIYNDLVFVSGQLSIDPQTGDKRFGPVEDQTELALRNVEAILKAANSDLSRVLKVTIFITDIDLWGAVNSVYARVFGEHKPARAIIPCGPLHHGFLIEIEAIAAQNE